MPRGFFITFEGLDGSGKSTQLRKLKDRLEAAGFAVTSTRQPGGTRIGDRIRGLLLDSRTEGVAPMAELALMFADRAQSIAEVILPAMGRGEIVLCDRYTDSTEAYQGGGRELGSRAVLDFEAILCGGLKPDLTILLLPNRDYALGRARRRNQIASAPKGRNENRFENEDAAFYRRVEEKYKEIASRDGSRVVSISSDGPIGEIHARVVKIVESRLNVRDQGSGARGQGATCC